MATSKNPLDDWDGYIGHRQRNVDPFTQYAKDALANTVSYAQLCLKTLLVLNGGGIFIVPAFAEHIGSIWAVGLLPPLFAIGSFVLGTLTAVFALAAAFYEFLNLQLHFRAAANRMAIAIDAQFKAYRAGQLINRDDAPSADEKRFERKSIRWEAAAQVFAWLSLFLFIFGSLNGVYIVACGNDDAKGEAVCRLFKNETEEVLSGP